MPSGFDNAESAINQQQLDALRALATSGRAGLAYQAAAAGVTDAASRDLVGNVAGIAAQAGAPAGLANEMAARLQALRNLYVGQAVDSYRQSEAEFVGQENANRLFFDQARSAVPIYRATAEQQGDQFRAAAEQRTKDRQAALEAQQLERESALISASTARAQAAATAEASRFENERAQRELAALRAAGYGAPAPKKKTYASLGSR